MKEYDFSKISDRKLELAVSNHKEGSGASSNICAGIKCRDCPFNSGGCYGKPDEIRKAFRKELKRRNKLKENERPELKAMDIVKVKGQGDKPFVVLPSEDELDLHQYPSGQSSYSESIEDIIEIQRKNSMYNYLGFFEGNYEKSYGIIWQAKTPQQQKIEELEETVKEATDVIKKATEQIEELKNANN